MTITIELPVELESKVREQASSEGVSAERFVIATLADRFSPRGQIASKADQAQASEPELLQAIARGPSEAVWRRYQELKESRRAGTLCPQEHAELIRLSDEIEESHVARLEQVERLARLRKMSFERLMAELGLVQDPSYD